MDHDHIEHRVARVWPILIVLAQAAVCATPAECPLHAPPFWHDDEAVPLVGTLEDLHADFPMAAQQRHSGLQHTGVRPIRPYPAPPGKPVTQEAQQLLGPVTVLHARRGHHDGDEPPQRVHEDMALAPVAPLGAIAAVLPAAVGGVDGRRVEKGRAGWAVAACQAPEVPAPRRIDPLPGAVTTPLPAIVRDNAPGRQLLGDKPPRPAGADDRQDGVDNVSLGRLLGSATRLGGRNQGYEHRNRSGSPK